MNTLDDLDWRLLSASLDDLGYALTGPALDAAQCAGLSSLYGREHGFRSTVNMGRHGFGKGQYRYFAYPLPDLVAGLRQRLYRALAPVANLWAERLGQPDIWPDGLDALTAQCHAFGQPRPTPLLLSYGPGDYNCLHQDLYGPIHFPLQAIVMLSAPDAFEGGALTIVENRPRMQSRVEVIPVAQGQVAIIPVRERPRPSAHGWSKTSVRHGVSTIRRGQRRTLGLIFHDAA
jgi:uncharacterized protein